MARRNPKIGEGHAPPGQDSFLDVVCNLVGILIILVMIVGARAKDAMVEELSQDPVHDEQLEREAHEARQTAAAIESGVQQANQELHAGKLQLAYRKAERDKLLLIVQAVEDQLSQERAKLDDSAKVDFDLRTSLAAVRNDLSALHDARNFVETQESGPSILEHLPTPMAKTVFGKELHFRLAGGRLSYVPMDELVERLKAEAPSKVWKLKEMDRTTESIGPEGGYLMHYTLQRVQQAVQTRAGTVSQQSVELDKFVLIPISETLGDPFEQAMQPGGRSEFQTRLSSQDPRKTTITVWVYPDSYGYYRTLKQALFQRGFLCAARPMMDGHPIGGSPRGTRSTAE